MSRFTVTYRLFAASAAEARARAEGVALEQTVEVPRDVVPEGFIADEIVGRVEEIGAEAEGRFRATVSYSPESTGTELPQLLNVMFGNSSIQKGIKVTGLDLGPLARAFPGPRFGIEGVRALAGCARGPMIAPVLKPQGTSPRTLAAIAERCARAGAHVVKEDHGLTDQPVHSFRARVTAIGAAVARANAEKEGTTLYFANLAGRSEDLMENARFAKEAGAHGLLIMPGLFGFDLVRRVAEAPDLGLPIMTHPSFLGPHVLSEDTGFTHGMMFGTLQRLAGSDISVFPNVGGRFGFTAEECLDIVSACQDPDGIGRPMLPSPGGGMSPERAADMRAMYGEDTVFLLGGSLLRHAERIGEAVADLLAALDRPA
ncbi:RuBisCO large subunit C-terminal-like domain-containing protein [Roseicyclus sp.]|uniref:RuBisCO large subunit C-terminal-like domain-containing protein n=1 Tax=Roseicyclus sp. TaxID=1914329 RepID=UPI003FA09AC8